LGDTECKPVNGSKRGTPSLEGNVTDCVLDGFNVTNDMLRKIVTDWQTPITLPLNNCQIRNMLMRDHKKWNYLEKTALAYTCQCHKGANDTVTSSDVCESVSSVKVDCTLDGIEVTKAMLKNIVSDKVPPLTKPISAAQKKKDDLDELLWEMNFTKRALRNIVADIPAPLTMSMSQRSLLASVQKKVRAFLTAGSNFLGIGSKMKADDKAELFISKEELCAASWGRSKEPCTLNGMNVTIQMLKNLITDKPSPITLPLNFAEHKK